MTACPQCQGSLPARAAFCGFCGLRISSDQAASVEPAAEDNRRTDVMAVPLFEDPEATQRLPAAAAAGLRRTLPPASSSAPTRTMAAQPKPGPLPRTEVRPVVRQRPRWLVPLFGATLLLTLALAVALVVKARQEPPPGPSPTAVASRREGPSTDDPLADDLPGESTPTKAAHRRSHGEVPPPGQPVPTDAAARPPVAPPPPPSPPVQAVRATTAAAEPPLTVRVGSAADGVRFVVQAHRRDVDACYDEADAHGAPALGGEVGVNFLIGSEGKAAFVRVVTNSTARPAIAGCLGELIGRWTFPYATSGELGVSYTFQFAPRPPGR